MEYYFSEHKDAAYSLSYHQVVRERLIDFSKWFDNNYKGEMITMEEIVDEYLKSINLALSEAQPISNNEYKKKICGYKGERKCFYMIKMKCEECDFYDIRQTD